MRKFRWLALAILLLLITIPSALGVPHNKELTPTGSNGIVTARYTYIDEQRAETYSSAGEKRRVNVVFWYPLSADDAETYPLIVFSHGGLGTENSNESLYRELASHGYVVCAIGHPFHAFWTKSEDGRMTFVSWEYFSELQREDAKGDKEQSFRYYQKWMEVRTADINFVLDTILARAAGSTDDVYALVDGTRIAVMGHSLGGSAALAIPRQRDDIAAVVALESPFLYDIIGEENGEFVWTDEVYPVPVLNIYSDSSWGHLSEWPQYARNAALLSGDPATATSLHLPGAGHFSLTDLVLVSPLLTRMLEGGQPNPDPAGYLLGINQACLGFFDRYLKNPASIKGENR